MPRYYGRVGYGTMEEVSPGVYEDVIVERVYYGDVIRTSRKLDPSDKVNSDISVNNQISIVADAYAFEHFFDIKYIEWSGALWKVPTVEVQRPRLVLWIGEVYK